MGKPDLYTVLEVNRTASEEEIKRSYRKLALRHHPDLNKNCEDSEALFIEITRAYDILRDEEARRDYDRYGHVRKERYRGNGTSRWARAPQGDSVFREPEREFPSYGYTRGPDPRRFETSTFRRARGRESWSRNRYGPARGSDLDYHLTLDFSQALCGVSVEVSILGNLSVVIVHPGVDTGSRIRVSGLGGPGLRGGPRGDLFLNITVSPDPKFRRSGADIHMDVPITLAEAVIGACVTFRGPEGALSLPVPAGTRTGTTFRFRGKGFPSPEEGGRGDLFVTTHVGGPERTNHDSRERVFEFVGRGPTNPEGGPEARGKAESTEERNGRY
jgi:curved DNA-binding protein